MTSVSGNRMDDGVGPLPDRVITPQIDSGLPRITVPSGDRGFQRVPLINGRFDGKAQGYGIPNGRAGLYQNGFGIPDGYAGQYQNGFRRVPVSDGRFDGKAQGFRRVPVSDGRFDGKAQGYGIPGGYARQYQNGYGIPSRFTGQYQDGDAFGRGKLAKAPGYGNGGIPLPGVVQPSYRNGLANGIGDATGRGMLAKAQGYRNGGVPLPGMVPLAYGNGRIVRNGISNGYGPPAAPKTGPGQAPYGLVQPQYGQQAGYSCPSGKCSYPGAGKK